MRRSRRSRATRPPPQPTNTKEDHISTDKLTDILISAGVPDTDVDTGYSDAYSHGRKNLAVTLADQASLSKFLKAAENHLGQNDYGRYFSRMRDAGAPDKVGIHKGGTIIFPDITL